MMAFKFARDSIHKPAIVLDGNHLAYSVDSVLLAHFVKAQVVLV